MLDGIIYTILDWVMILVKSPRKYMIEKSLPNPCKSAVNGEKDFEKHKKTLTK